MGRIFDIVFAISYISLWAAAMLLIPFPFNLAFYLFISVVVYYFDAGFSMVIATLWSLFGKIKLSLDRERMYLTHRVLGLNYLRIKVVLIKDITALSCHDDESEIYIHASTGLCVLGDRDFSYGFDYCKLTKLERKWLANELCDWLGFQFSNDGNIARKPSG